MAITGTNNTNNPIELFSPPRGHHQLCKRSENDSQREPMSNTESAANKNLTLSLLHLIKFS
jgi:hypothetical protein